jgi:cellulose synthase/poly-beta-1,6-N-acetylglucosamine synthase-like glycosyltransferase
MVITPLMHFITEIGCFLFSYPYIKHGDILDYTYFWGGRSSCKRTFLIEHGVFNQVFRFGCEDIELGFRLSQHNLRVVYNSHAISYMIRPINFDDFCKRLIKQGRSQFVFSQLHNDPYVLKWTEVIDADKTWETIKDLFFLKLKSARDLDKIANMKMKYNLNIDEETLKILHNLYWWVFKACKIKGIIEAKEKMSQIIKNYQKTT